jgi:hypothetical protein
LAELQPRHIQQFFDPGAHPRGRRVDVLGDAAGPARGRAAQELRLALDRRQRIPQVWETALSTSSRAHGSLRRLFGLLALGDVAEIDQGAPMSDPELVGSTPDSPRTTGRAD